MKETLVTRRAAIGVGLGAAAAAGAFILKKSGVLEKQAEENDFDESFLDVPKKPDDYTMGKLEGKRFSGLLSAYTIGEERQVMSQELIDFRYQQARLWHRKLEHVREKNPNSYSRVRDAAKSLFTSYNQASSTKISLNEYIEQAGVALGVVRSDLDLEHITHLMAFKELKPSQVDLLKKLEERINGKALIAYALTEIMPTKGEDSTTGVEVLDFLLRNAGIEFVDRIPAVHDSRISIGPYQFTSDALYAADKEHRGASLIQLMMKTQHIPQSVVQLEGDMNHKAAYLFAIYNLAMLGRRLGENRSKKLLEHISGLPSDIVTQYIASAHHLPKNAMQAFEAYTDEYLEFQTKSEEEKNKTPLTSQTPPPKAVA